jgi:hypothetical protein
VDGSAAVIDLEAEVYTDATLGEIVIFKAADPGKWATLKVDAVQPGESFVVTFRYKNTIEVAGRPLRLSPHLSALSPDTGARRAVDKLTFRVYTQLFSAGYLEAPGNTESDCFRTEQGDAKSVREIEAPLPSGVPPIQRRQTELDWVSHLSRDRTVSLDTIQPGDVLYIHYWFYWDGSLGAVAPERPGDDPLQNVNIDPATGRHRRDCADAACTHDNHYMGLPFSLEWKLYATYATSPSPVGYTLRHQDASGTTLAPDAVTQAAASTKYAGDRWEPSPLADLVVEGVTYQYLGYKVSPSGALTGGAPTRLLTGDASENVLILVYEPRPATPSAVSYTLKYQNAGGATLAADAVTSAAASTKYAGETWTVSLPIADLVFEGAVYRYVGYKAPPSGLLTTEGAPFRVLTGDASENVLILIYELVEESTPTPTPGGGSRPNPTQTVAPASGIRTSWAPPSGRTERWRPATRTPGLSTPSMRAPTPSTATPSSSTGRTRRASSCGEATPTPSR